jgi:hypothetical protein
MSGIVIKLFFIKLKKFIRKKFDFYMFFFLNNKIDK